LDAHIPFIEYFIVPYLLWFAYIGVTGVYFLFWEKKSFCRLMYYGMIGMTLFIVASYLYPNGLEIRPDTFVRDNIFVTLTQWIYKIDTATNVFPSIHVFNSVGVNVAIHRSKRLEGHVWIQRMSSVLMTLIILSTVFVKQHSLVDVLSALLLSCVAYDLVYNKRWEDIKNSMRAERYRKKTEPGWFSK
jgi:membrane-associated phospholipid phosphatase